MIETTKPQGAEAGGLAAGTQGVSKQQYNDITSCPLPQARRPVSDSNPQRQLTPRQRRIMTALNGNPDGIWSFDLGLIAGALNVADAIMRLRRMGVNILCEMEPFVNQDGEKSSVGRYRLVDQGE